MTRLDKAANDVVRLAKKMAAEKIKKEKVKPKIWNGKMIIPLAKWRKKQNFGTHEWRNYYPDKYVPNLLLPHGNNERIMEYQAEWWRGFSQYLESVKESGYGKCKCQMCILNPVALPLTTTIRDAMVKTNQSMDGKPLEFPCAIVNKFECPYEDKDQQDDLAVLGMTWRILDEALKYNGKLTKRKHNTYTVDFVKKEVIKILYLDNQHLQIGSAEYFFSRLKFPKFEIIGHRGLYDVITTRDKLRSVLEEYLDALSSGAEDNRYELDAEYVRKEIDYFLDIFDKIKDLITLESLKNTNGNTLRDIEDENEKSRIFWAEREKFTPTKSTMPKPEEISGACFSCGQFANIICNNCKIWTCLAHWRDHGIQTHNYTSPENSSSDMVQQ